MPLRYVVVGLLIEPTASIERRERAVQRLSGPDGANGGARHAETGRQKRWVTGVEVPQHPMLRELAREIECVKPAPDRNVHSGQDHLFMPTTDK
jgi:hypothetical protein